MAKNGGPTSYSMNLSYLSRLIKKKGFDRETLSNLVGVSTVAIHRWVVGKANITAKNLVKLARALEVDPCRLLDGDDQRAIRYLRDLINRKIEHEREENDITLVDIATFLSIMKVLGYDERSAVGKIPINLADLEIPTTEAEKQVMGILDGET